MNTQRKNIKILKPQAELLIEWGRGGNKRNVEDDRKERESGK